MGSKLVDRKDLRMACMKCDSADMTPIVADFAICPGCYRKMLTEWFFEDEVVKSKLYGLPEGYIDGMIERHMELVVWANQKVIEALGKKDK